MKSSVAIAMIVCGTILIAAPYVFNTISMYQVTETMAAMNGPVSVRTGLSEDADTACLAGGFIMILVGAIAGLRSNKQD